MSESATETIVGGLVLAGAVVFLLYADRLTGFGQTGDSAHQYTASFRSIQGVSVGTDVRMAGVKVGSVTDLTLDKVTFRAEATIEVSGDVDLPADTAIVVASEGLLGGNFVELLPGGALENLDPGSEIEDTQSSIGLVNLLMRFVTGEDGE